MRQFIRFAAEQDSIVILSQPIVQRDMEARWQGAILEALFKGKGVNPWGEAVPLDLRAYVTLLLYFLLLVVPLNALALPLFAAFPPLRDATLSKLRARGTEGEVHGVRRESGYCEALKMW